MRLLPNVLEQLYSFLHLLVASFYFPYSHTSLPLLHTCQCTGTYPASVDGRPWMRGSVRRSVLSSIARSLGRRLQQRVSQSLGRKRWVGGARGREAAATVARTGGTGAGGAVNGAQLWSCVRSIHWCITRLAKMSLTGGRFFIDIPSSPSFTCSTRVSRVFVVFFAD